MRVTVLTPSFNRADYLPELYRSLMSQDVDLEWLIIDDGSEDGTGEVVRELEAQSPFPIRYRHQRNLGKHWALNHGVAVAEGEVIAQVDSDDLMCPGALRRLLEHWHDLSDPRVIGLLGHCVDESGRLIGTRFPADPIDANWQEMAYRYGVKGDKSGIFRTDILRSHPFPEIPGYVAESVVWRRIGQRYLTRHVNEDIVVCRASAANRITGRPFAEIASGAKLQHGITLTDDMAWFRARPAAFYRAAVHYSRACFHLKEPVWSRAREFDIAISKAMVLGGMPLGWLLYQRDVRRSSR
ncbi:glycosyltransferase family A protein [Nonomuraea sp. NPDC050786]|uniref:glycosyltransferase family 2 protein n=1 Tax=Nonomuraea sp. NPDC050786 TaxID=3154840 RepID=UPI0033D00584